MLSTTRRRLALLALLSLPFTRVNAQPKFVFLSSELQPLLVDATGLASLRQRGLVVDVEAAPAPGQPARVLRLSRPDRQERGG